MKTELELNEMILEISNKIRKNRPELLPYLDEMPLTVPYCENPEMVTATLKTYHDSLEILYNKNEKSKNKLNEKAETMSIPEIKTMELDNAYQNLIVEANDISLSYIDVGIGVVPIIFLHGFPFDKTTWHSQLDALKNTNRVIAIDIRGFGQSKDEKTPLTIDLFSDDLLAFMDKLKIEKAVICGLSMGGYIALNAINKFPKRVRALILCDTQCIVDTAEVRENRYKNIEKIRLSNATEFNENFIKSVFYFDSLVTKTEVVQQLRSIVFANSNEIIMAGLAALAERYETCSILNKIAVPTLIICGKEDRITPLNQSEFLYRNITNAKIKIIQNAGHVSNLEQPEVFNNFLKDFINSLN